MGRLIGSLPQFEYAVPAKVLKVLIFAEEITGVVTLRQLSDITSRALRLRSEQFGCFI